MLFPEGIYTMLNYYIGMLCRLTHMRGGEKMRSPSETRPMTILSMLKETKASLYNIVIEIYILFGI